MGEQRSSRDDEIVLKGETSVEELHNSDGPKVEDDKDCMLGFGGPRFERLEFYAGQSLGHARAKLCSIPEEKGSQDYGRDTNRLDYFSFTAFDVLGDDDDLTTITDYGGGGGGDRNREVVAGSLLEQDRSTANGGDERSKVEQDRGTANGGDTSRQIPMKDVANNGNGGGEMVVETPEQEMDSGGKKRIGGGERTKVEQDIGRIGGGDIERNDYGIGGIMEGSLFLDYVSLYLGIILGLIVAFCSIYNISCNVFAQ